MLCGRRPTFAWLVPLGLAAACAAASPAVARTTHSTHAAAAAADPLPDLPPDLAPDPTIDPDASLEVPPSQPSGVAARLADWIAASDDNEGLPFMVVDKLAADIFVYAADGRLMGRAPVLVGLAPGDDSAPGVGNLPLSEITPDQRTTPAGRFVAQFGPSKGHGTMLWVDAVDAISLHPVMSVNAGERRQQRIRSADPEEHRISYGCINVPAKFYNDVVLKTFSQGGVVYILPDTKTIADVFPAFAAASDADARVAETAPADRCADPLRDVPDGIPDPDPTLMCPADDVAATDSPAR